MFQKKYLRACLKLAIFALCCVATQRFCRKQTDTFALYKILSELPHHAEWEIPESSKEELASIKHILNQPFHYLGRGAQCYVFVSDDHQYVIKFFRLYHLLPPFWTKLPLPPFLHPYRLAKMVQKQGELQRDFLSYKIAFEQMREETGLLYVHLNKTNMLNQHIQIFDRLNICHELDLDQMEFLVQKRADLLYPALANIVEREGLDAARESLSHLLDLLVLRCKKGIFDKDPDLNTNFGLIGHTPIQIDVGRYRILEDSTPGTIDRDEIIRITDNLNQWLRANYPTLSDHLETQIRLI